MQNGQGARTGMAVAGAAAAGLIAGIAVNAGRKAMTQAAEAMTGDWFDALKAEHLMFMELFDELDTTTPDEVGKRKRLTARIKAAIDKHAFEEENVIYPAIRLSESDEAARKLVLEHAEVKTLLYEIEFDRARRAQLHEDGPGPAPRARGAHPRGGGRDLPAAARAADARGRRADHGDAAQGGREARLRTTLRTTLSMAEGTPAPYLKPMSDQPDPTAPEGAAPGKTLTPAARRALEEAAERRAADPARAANEDGGPSGPEPTRYGDWERKGVAVDF